VHQRRIISRVTQKNLRGIVDTHESKTVQMTADLLQEKFSGSLLGGMLGDVIGAVVEAESPGYIRKTFKDIDEILALESVPELFGGKWKVGRFTDDTQMSICVAEWLLQENKLDGKTLLEKFSQSYQPWRRYGPGASFVLENFPKYPDKWAELATAMFPQGSYGNGSAMRVSPVGLFFHNSLPSIIRGSKISSVVTHAHYLAIQGAALQATAVGLAARSLSLDAEHFIRILSATLSHFEEQIQDVSIFRRALEIISQGISRKVAPEKLADVLGTGIKAQEAVPMAIYCFLAHPESYERAVKQAVFLGGDTDTIACMTGSISGAYLGEKHIPKKWLLRVKEDFYNPEKLREIAVGLWKKGRMHQFKG
jgi:poly(ADP-ribose) glycohydrolase ARH3